MTAAASDATNDTAIDESGPAGSGGAPGLVGLVMIVKDEAHGIARTLDSLRGEIDRWTILDTGSTDGTQDVVRSVLASIPGILHEEPFAGFATSRNRALDLHGESTTFALMPDSDDYLVGAPGALRGFCEARRDGHPDEAYLIALRRDPIPRYHLPLLMRTSARWRYRGRVHEVAGGPSGTAATVRVPGVELRQEFVERSAQASRARWTRDLALLADDLAADPRDARALFYLAQTHECLGDPERALAGYEARIRAGGWADETFEARMRRARILASLGRPWDEVQEAYLEAHCFDPSRAEPLYEIASHYYDRQHHAASYLFAQAAAALPAPATPMFTRQDVYDWRAADTASISAYYVADRAGSPAVRESGRRLGRQAVRGSPSDARLRHNLSFYARSAAEVFPGFAARPIQFSCDPPFSPMNPSVHFDGERWRCLVRTVNYRIDDGRYYGPGGNEIRTRNYLLELTGGLDTERAVEMRDDDPTPRSDFPVHGFEDCRLFFVDGRPLATATVCDFTPHGAREIALLSLDPNDYRVLRARTLRGAWSAHHQKNWMPFVERAPAGDRLRVLYSTLPEVVLEIDLGAGERGDPTVRARSASAAGDLAPGPLRGGSQGVCVPGGWLFVVHTVDASENARTYLHRFVLLSPELRTCQMSEPFYFLRRGVEFCAGLALEGDRLVASFGVEDREAHLGVFRIGDVLGRLRPDLEI